MALYNFWSKMAASRPFWKVEQPFSNLTELLCCLTWLLSLEKILWKLIIVERLRAKVQNFGKNGHQGAVLQVRTPNFELSRAFMHLNTTVKFEKDSSKTMDCRALTRQLLTHGRTDGRTHTRQTTTQHRDHCISPSGLRPSGLIMEWRGVRSGERC